MRHIPDEHLDDVVRQVVLANDPFRGMPAPPPQASPAELRARAEAGGRHTMAGRPGLGRWVPPVAASVLVVVATAAAAILAGVLARGADDPAPQAGVPTPSGTSGAPPPAPRPLSIPRTGDPVAVRTHLDALADAARRAPATPVAGAYTYVRVRTWTAGPSGQAPPAARDEQLWWAADRSGRRLVTAAGAAHSEQTTYEAGKVPVVVEVPSAQAALLAFQLADEHPLAEGPQGRLRAVADLYRFHDLDPAQRAAALQVLADTDGLDYRGQVVDREGRGGVAISVDSDGGATRDVAIFDPATGRLLSYEQVAPLGSPSSRTRAPVLVAYVLYLAAGRVDQPGVVL
ncbi:hypothetical protein [Phytohabitans rumicis]|uniref:CU044_5270 family protein n=1 Tax=Phytohabitans rumicis TaxID=1076125 RepID=A0A6V8L6V0_9ACTN|nr:hypothetical protein [Phytohabitans rumicis]GFJ88375.1 hypothetical protein Prum_020170 [Phytohabitans rumicis]